MGQRKLKKKMAKEYRHGDLRSALILAALDSIDKTGEVEFSLRDLSLKAGVTHAAAYRHFSSKKDILFAIAKDGYSRLEDQFSKVLEKDPENIVQLGITYVLFAAQNPHHFKVMFHPDIKTVNTNDPTNSLGQKAFSHLLSAVEANKESGRFSKEDPHMIAMTAWAGVHGLATLIVNEHINEKMNVSPISLSENLTKNLMQGFLKR
jgi:AcrR family transcriptional regulator